MKITGSQIEIMPKDEIYTVVVHSGRGMLSVIKVLVIQNNKIIDISGVVAKFLGHKFNRIHGGVSIIGTGFSPGNEIVSDISRILFGSIDKLIHRSL